MLDLQEFKAFLSAFMHAAGYELDAVLDELTALAATKVMQYPERACFSAHVHTLTHAHTRTQWPSWPAGHTADCCAPCCHMHAVTQSSSATRSG